MGTTGRLFIVPSEPVPPKRTPEGVTFTLRILNVSTSTTTHLLNFLHSYFCLPPLLFFHPYLYHSILKTQKQLINRSIETQPASTMTSLPSLPISTADVTEAVKIRMGTKGMSAIPAMTIMDNFNEIVQRCGDKPALYQKVLNEVRCC
jgi:hypothetical protein